MIYITSDSFVNRQCSECDPSSDDEEMEVDPEDTTPISQGRQRRIIKEPTKFTPDKGEVRDFQECNENMAGIAA